MDDPNQSPLPDEDASPSEKFSESPPLEAHPAEPPAPTPPVWPGVLTWFGVSAVYIALGFIEPLSGLWFAVPLILAFIFARALERWPRTRRVLGALTVAAALASVGTGLALLIWSDRLIDPPDSQLTWYAATVAGYLIAAGLLTLLCVIRRTRERLFAWVRLDPSSAVHITASVMVALSLATAVGLFLLLQDAPGETILLYLIDPLIALLTDVPLALAGVGFLLTRNLGATLERLDFRALSLKQLAWALPTTALFLFAVGLFDYFEELLLPEIYALEERFPMRFADVSPVVGAPAVSIAAGIGEEAVFRGALQPRFGIVLTSLLFGVAHVQYQIPGMIMIFLIGLGLGILKEKTSTTFTALIHVLYDIAAILLPS